MSKKIRNTEVDHLFDAILTLENKEECLYSKRVAFYFTEI